MTALSATSWEWVGCSHFLSQCLFHVLSLSRGSQTKCWTICQGLHWASLFVISSLLFQTLGIIPEWRHHHPVLIKVSANKPLLILFSTEMINPQKSFSSPAHPHQQCLHWFSLTLGQAFSFCALCYLRYASFPTGNGCTRGVSFSHPRPTPCPETQGRSCAQAAPALQSDAASGNIPIEMGYASPALVVS